MRRARFFRISLRQGCKVEHYRGADWLRPRLQEPQKRWIPGKGPRVRIHLPPAESHTNLLVATDVGFAAEEEVRVTQFGMAEGELDA